MIGLQRPVLVKFTTLLEKFGDETGPTGLVVGADTGAGITVKILVKQDQIAPVGVALKFLLVREHGTASVGVTQKNIAQAA
jgi:hypothetical protein